MGYVSAGALFRSLPCGPLDIAFVLDSTSSMGDAVDPISADITAILDDIEIASNNDYRLALVTFHDWVDVLENFSTNNRATFEAALATYADSGGDNRTEASDEALNTVIHALPERNRRDGVQAQFGNFTPAFRSGVQRLIFLVTDEANAGFDDWFVWGEHDVKLRQWVDDAAADGIRICAFWLPNWIEDNVSYPEPIWKNAAFQTNGYYVRLSPDGTGTADAVRDVLAACGGSLSPTPADQLAPIYDDFRPNPQPFYGYSAYSYLGKSDSDHYWMDPQDVGNLTTVTLAPKPPQFYAWIQRPSSSDYLNGVCCNNYRSDGVLRAVVGRPTDGRLLMFRCKQFGSWDGVPANQLWPYSGWAVRINSTSNYQIVKLDAFTRTYSVIATLSKAPAAFNEIEVVLDADSITLTVSDEGGFNPMSTNITDTFQQTETLVGLGVVGGIHSETTDALWAELSYDPLP